MVTYGEEFILWRWESVTSQISLVKGPWVVQSGGKRAKFIEAEVVYKLVRVELQWAKLVLRFHYLVRSMRYHIISEWVRHESKDCAHLLIICCISICRVELLWLLNQELETWHNLFNFSLRLAIFVFSVLIHYSARIDCEVPAASSIPVALKSLL